MGQLPQERAFPRAPRRAAQLVRSVHHRPTLGLPLCQSVRPGPEIAQEPLSWFGGIYSVRRFDLRDEFTPVLLTEIDLSVGPGSAPCRLLSRADARVRKHQLAAAPSADSAAKSWNAAQARGA